MKKALKIIFGIYYYIDFFVWIISRVALLPVIIAPSIVAIKDCLT